MPSERALGRTLSYGGHHVDEHDVQAVVQALRSDRLTQGPAVESFERGLARSVDAPHAVAVSSGTAALHLAYAALGLQPGQEIITSPITFVATANAARMLGAEVRFADVDPATGNLDPEDVARRITPKTVGIVPVHFAGCPADMGALDELARERGLWLVEDAAHALGARSESGPVGNARTSAAVTFSFHPVKTITTGEGGAITTRSAELAQQLRRLREHGLLREGPPEAQGMWGYQMLDLGYNYRLSDIQAALGCSQLTRLGAWVRRRNALARLYRRRLRQVSQVRVQPVAPGLFSGYHLMSVAVDFEGAGRSRAEVMQFLRHRGVGTQVHYIPVSRQPYYLERYGECELPGADAFYARQLSLPLHVDMTASDVERVVDVLQQALSA